MSEYEHLFDKEEPDEPEEALEIPAQMSHGIFLYEMDDGSLGERIIGEKEASDYQRLVLAAVLNLQSRITADIVMGALRAAKGDGSSKTKRKRRRR